MIRGVRPISAPARLFSFSNARSASRALRKAANWTRHSLAVGPVVAEAVSAGLPASVIVSAMAAVSGLAAALPGSFFVSTGGRGNAGDEGASGAGVRLNGFFQPSLFSTGGFGCAGVAGSGVGGAGLGSVGATTGRVFAAGSGGGAGGVVSAGASGVAVGAFGGAGVFGG